MTTCFIDLEAFQDENGHYIIKELCFMDINNIFKPLFYVFKSTVSLTKLSKKVQMTNMYLSKYYHRLTKNEGNTRFC